jgi:hypothetical protein
MSERYKIGERIPIDARGYLKIMAFAEGYYMARFKGCLPFIAREPQIYAIIKAHKP